MSTALDMNPSAVSFTETVLNRVRDAEERYYTVHQDVTEQLDVAKEYDRIAKKVLQMFTDLMNQCCAFISAPYVVYDFYHEVKKKDIQTLEMSITWSDQYMTEYGDQLKEDVTAVRDLIALFANDEGYIPRAYTERNRGSVVEIFNDRFCFKFVFGKAAKCHAVEKKVVTTQTVYVCDDE